MGKSRKIKVRKSKVLRWSGDSDMEIVSRERRRLKSKAKPQRRAGEG